jgi:hypothetical protein
VESVLAGSRAAARRTALWLFVCLNCFYLLTSTGRVRTVDEYLTLFETESLVLRGSLTVPQAVQARTFYGKYDLNREPRAPYPPGHVLAAAPWYAAGRYVLARLPGVPEKSTDLILGFAVTLSSATFSALAAALAFLLYCELGTGAGLALFSTTLLALATPLYSYSGWFFSEPLAAALIAGAALVLFGRAAEEPVPPPAALLAGMLLGYAVFTRFTHLLAGILFVIAVLLRDGRRGLRAAVTVAVFSFLGLFALLALNYSHFGNAFEFGYPEMAEGGKRLNTFETPLSVGLFGFLFSPGKSVFLFAPPILLALYGLPTLWRRDRGLAAAAALTPLAYLLFFARYTQWEGGYCFGPRYLVPPLALLCLALGPALAGAGPRLRRAAMVLLLAGFLVQSVGLGTSFLQDQAQRGAYYDAQYNYNLNYAPLVSQSRLFWRSLTSPEPAPLGLGFDRWFVFLAKGGVAPATLATLGGLMAFALALSAWRLGVSLRREPV